VSDPSPQGHGSESKERTRLLSRLRLAEEELRRVVEHIPAFVFRVAPDGTMRYVNRTLPGLKMEDVVGRSAAEFVPPDQRASLLEAIVRVARTGEPSQIEVVGMGEHGERSHYVSRFAPLLQDGKVVEVLGLSTDVTPYKEAEERLRRSEELYRRTLEAVPAAIVHVAADGSIVQANRVAQDILGLTFDDVTRLNVADFRTRTFGEDGRECRVEDYPVSQVLKTGKPAGPATIGVMHPDGRMCWAVFTAVPLQPGSDGRPGGAVVTFLDLTERKRLEEQLLRAQKMESIGRLAGGIAHDFNNMLTSILGYADLAARGLPDDSPAQIDLRSIRGVAKRASTLVRQLLAYARRQRIQPIAFSLNAMVLRSERMLRQLLGERIDLRVETAEGSDLVLADPALIEQVLINLVLNARDAMADGGTLRLGSEWVEVDEREAGVHADARPGRFVVLIVQDNGIGMSEEVRRQLFEPFFTTKSPSRGTGLGLASCYGIVVQNGGHIRVESRPGEGAAFRVYLPAGEGAPADAEEKDPPRAKGGRETVLLAEDDPTVRDTLARVLEDHGYQVLAAGNGEDALARANAHAGRIDLLVADVVMPRMGGRELADRLGRDRPDLKVLFISGHGDKGASGTGGIAFLQKPFVSADLLLRVRAILDDRGP